MQWQNGQISCHREVVSPDLINHFHYLHLQPGARVLAPLCGKSEDIKWLAAQGHPVIGVELSPIACRDFFAEMSITPRITQLKNFIHYKHNNIELLCGDIFKLKMTDLPPIDAIYDCRALIALPAAIRQQYVHHLLACCSKSVQILLMGFYSPSQIRGQIKGPPFSISDDEINRLFGINFKVKILQQTSLTEIPKHLANRDFQEIMIKIYLISM